MQSGILVSLNVNQKTPASNADDLDTAQTAVVLMGSGATHVKILLGRSIWCKSKVDGVQP